MNIGGLTESTTSAFSDSLNWPIAVTLTPSPVSPSGLSSSEFGVAWTQRSASKFLAGKEKLGHWVSDTRDAGSDGKREGNIRWYVVMTDKEHSLIVKRKYEDAAYGYRQRRR